MGKHVSLEKNLEKGILASQNTPQPPSAPVPSARVSAKIVLLGEDHSGRDEMNLAGNPFALLQAASKNRSSLIRYEWDRQLTNGKVVEASWEVSGHPELGLPGPSDELLYLVLLQITRETVTLGSSETWPQTINFSRWDVLNRMGWPDAPKFYRALEEGFARLKAVTIRAHYSFWDARSKTPLPAIGFSIIDEYVIADEPRGRKGQKNATIPLSSFKWSDRIHASLTAGNVRDLALDFVISLDHPTARRLFRFLDMHRKATKPPRREFSIGIIKLRDRIGMTDYKYASKIKEKLVTAHEELIERGYLEKVEYVKSKADGGDMALYHFADARLALPSIPTGRTEFVAVSISSPDPSPEKRNVAVDGGCDIYPIEAHTVFTALPAADQERLRQLARKDVEPAFWDRLERPDSPMALVLWEIVIREFPDAYAAAVNG